VTGKRWILFLLFAFIITFVIGYVVSAWLVADQGSDQAGLPDNKGQGNSADMTKPEDPIRKQIETMSLEEKIGQLVLVGLEGYEIDDHTKCLIRDYHVGGFILFRRNIRDAGQMLTILNSLKEANAANKVPLFLSIDEEGGRISRLPQEFLKLPAAGKIGSVNDADLSYQIGSIIGEILKALGINMNFAPVLDINSNPRNPVIGDRSFGAEAKTVSKLGIAAMKGLQEQGIIPVVKHFPGHGDTDIDSHVGLPVLKHDLSRLKSLELKPFNAAIENKAEGIMIAHILLPELDAQAPASLSKPIITGLLREQMNYDGVVITDDLTMGAITDNYEIGAAAVKAVLAGSDIVLVCHGYENGERVLRALTEAAKSGLIPAERIEESLYRILSLKKKYNLSDSGNSAFDVQAVNNRISKLFKECPGLAD